MPRTATSRPPFELLILDLDGTLVSSSAIFHRAARRVLARLAEARGTTVLMPAVAATDALLGLPWRELISGLVPDLNESERALVTEWLHAEETALLEQELDPRMLFPGALEALDLQRRRGVRLSVASNCQAFYLDAVMRATGLGQRIELPLCLSTPGISNKVEMVARALAHFGTRRAAMIGDRIHDKEAAAANGIGFLYFAGANYGACDDLRDVTRFADWSQLDAALQEVSAT